ncbi:MAG: hypothetical protein GF317_15085 [Candidatus Lokiarchaeota archaeon]|nr:hypothetical protein [Candidatus Lokiarchaeota archaeon]
MNFKEIVRIACEYKKLTKENCQYCPIRFLCERCYPTFAGDGKFEIDQKFCERMKKDLVTWLNRYIKLNEMGITPYNVRAI